MGSFQCINLLLQTTSFIFPDLLHEVSSQLVYLPDVVGYAIQSHLHHTGLKNGLKGPKWVFLGSFPLISPNFLIIFSHFWHAVSKCAKLVLPGVSYKILCTPI